MPSLPHTFLMPCISRTSTLPLATTLTVPFTANWAVRQRDLGSGQSVFFFFFFLGLGFQFDQFLFWILFLGFLGLWKFEKGEWEKKRTRGRWGKNDLCLFCWRIRRRTIWVWVPVPLQTLENICTVNVADVNWARWTPYGKSANSDPIRTWKLTLKDSIYCPKSSLLDLRC